MIQEMPRLAKHEREFRTEASQAENVLIGCLLLRPKLTKRLPLLPTDFRELGTGEAFAEIHSQVRTFDQIDHTRFGISPDEFRVDIQRMKTALVESVGPEAGSLMLDWITTWVDHWHWGYYAMLVARASYSRLIEEIAAETMNDLQDSTLAISAIDERQAAFAQIKRDMRTRLNGVLLFKLDKQSRLEVSL